MNTKVNEGKLISEKEAFNAYLDDLDVEFQRVDGEWILIDENTKLVVFVSPTNFRLKPRTISINGIEVPAPADDKDYHHQGIWILNSLELKEYGYVVLDITDELPRYWWKSEEEIKQVVAALRQVFGGSHDN